MTLASGRKADAKRDAILDTLADHVLAEGLAASSLRILARAADTSDRMLLYYFADKPQMITAVLGRIAERLTATLSMHQLTEPQPLRKVEALLAERLLNDETIWPYMRLWLEIASLAAGGDAFYRSVGEQLGRGFLAWGAAQIHSESPEQHAHDAARLLVSIEGMALLRSIGMEDVSKAALDD